MIRKLHYAYVVCLCLLLFAAPQTTQAQTLVAGDIVVLGFNADDAGVNAGPNQRWAFMAMTNISAGTSINFTDNGYDGSTGEFRTGATNDGHMRWITPGAITKGTIIYATNNTVNGSSTGVTGQLGGAGGYFHTTGDQVIVYQGTLGTAVGATFIYAFNNGQTSAYTGGDGSWITSGAIGSGVTFDSYSYIPPGLNALTSVSLTSDVGNSSSGPGTLGTANYGFDNMRYGGTTTGYRNTLLTAIANPVNWLGDNTTGYNFTSGGVYPTNTFSVLPVTLLYFNAQAQAGETVHLTWGTAMESNNEHFTIERSTDGVHYNIISIIPGKGDFNEPVDYSFIDHAPEQGSSFYRLSQTDRDGKEKILGVKTVTMQDVGLRVGPNPAVNEINVSFNSSAWREIKLYNSADQLLQTIPLTIAAGRTCISLQNYRPGTYYLAFVGNNGKSNTVRRFVKKD
ncbi:MAG TPA: T9SS type A sorting domain-containing protein [Niastella sp.]